MLPEIPLSWYLALVMGFTAFVFQRHPLNLRASSTFCVIYAMGFLGAVLSLLRAPHLDVSLMNTVANGINFMIYIFFIPVLASRSTRQVLLFILIGSAMLWVLEVQRLLSAHEYLLYSTFAETGSDKNFIGFSMSLISIALFYLAIFMVRIHRMPKAIMFCIRIFFGLGSIYLLYNVSLIYARSAVIANLLGLLAILLLLFITNPNRVKLLRVGAIITLLSVSIYYMVPKVLESSPYWENMYFSAAEKGVDSFYLRTNLIDKGIYIITTNPLLGVGIGGSRFAIKGEVSYPPYLIHNSYLSDWAEKGLLGFLSNVVWIFAYLKFLKKHFFNFPIFDQVWLILMIPLFFNMNFLDMTSVSMFMLAIFSGMLYERYYVSQNRVRTTNELHKIYG